eukprot:208097_1
MISLILLSILRLARGSGDQHVCSLEHNPVCCPDPKHVDVPISDYRPYGNVCEFSYGIDPNTKKGEDAINCGYGECPLCACSMIYKPTCCNGVEYPNECEADCDGQNDCSAEACPDTCPCTQEWRPVCCPEKDDAEFANPCAATCAGLTAAELIACFYGTCEKPETDCICTTIYEPHCCGGKDYASACVAECDGIDVSKDCEKTDGVCEVCPCTADYQPVCCPSKPAGGPRQTYGNSCSARCERSEAELLECYYGECPTCICPMISTPTCCNGVEYGNPCEAECAKATGCTDGRCPATYDNNSDDQGDDVDNDDDDESDEQDDNKGKGEDKGTKPPKVKAFGENSIRDCICTLDYKPTCCKSNDPYSDISETTYGNECEAECDGADLSNCAAGECESGLCVCTREYNAVCCPRKDGEPGEQFSNPCTAACVKDAGELIGCHYGICDDQCPCPMIEAPVCCNGKEYGNECGAKCSGENTNECTDGKCPVACPLIYLPVCCDGNKEYSNQCMADAAGATGCKEDTCEEPCKCTYEYIPLCCGDTTYGNVCQAVCADEDLVTCDYGECNEEICDCKEKEKPVCCNGDTEYKNKCLAKCAKEGSQNCKQGSCSS